MSTALRPVSEERNKTAAESRGRLVIADKVIEKIASQAASELDAVGGSSGGFLGMGAAHELSARPKARVHLSGQVATIELTVAVRYPVPLRRTGEQIRQKVQRRVTEWTGVEVRQVDIDIAWLLPAETTQGTRRLL